MMGDILPERHMVAAVGALLIAAMGGFNAVAQPASNDLVPGIAPYAPKAPLQTSPSAKPRHPTPHAAGAPARAATTASAGPAAAAYDYRLGPGDKLRITVFGEDGLTGEFFVAGNGRISFPLIGEVPAGGKTVQAVQDEITAALRDGYLKDPKVSAEVLIFRPYYILGEVTKPGEYPYRDGITVMNAVATAGGFTYRANTKYVYLKKSNEDIEHKVRLTDDLKIEPGETARIIERYF
jgi:protein involved in polysaccharide export with SLBB domain